MVAWMGEVLRLGRGPSSALRRVLTMFAVHLEPRACVVRCLCLDFAICQACPCAVHQHGL